MRRNPGPVARGKEVAPQRIEHKERVDLLLEHIGNRLFQEVCQPLFFEICLAGVGAGEPECLVQHLFADEDWPAEKTTGLPPSGPATK